MISDLPPGLALILGAFLLPAVGPRVRPVLVLGLPLVTLGWIWNVPDGANGVIPFFDYELVLVKGDTLSREEGHSS